jgi:predicted nuclease of predicted toxin-antitoxin system
MRWLADECVAAPHVASLRAQDQDVLYVAESVPGLSDREVIALAQQQNRILLTEDKDFGDLVFRRELAVPGVVLIRAVGETATSKMVRLGSAIKRYGEGLFGRYTVIEETRFRSRYLRSDRWARTGKVADYASLLIRPKATASTISPIRSNT